MRGKRSKQYRKLMEQFSMTFGFREPYQVLVDADMVKDACQFKMDLAPALQRTLHGAVKPMITQCEIRKLYALNKEPGVAKAIESAKNLERRRCGHHPDEFPEPLDTLECMAQVVDPKKSGQNKHRYVVASQSQEVRHMLRGVRGVPLIYIKRSVMILEPMADESAQARYKEERSKFRAEIKKTIGKRKREEKDEEDETNAKLQSNGPEGGDHGVKEGEKKTKKRWGPKGPNPLSVKKSKKQHQDSQPAKKGPQEDEIKPDGTGKRKRRRKNKTSDGVNDGEGSGVRAVSQISSVEQAE